MPLSLSAAKQEYDNLFRELRKNDDRIKNLLTGDQTITEEEARCLKAEGVSLISQLSAEDAKAFVDYVGTDTFDVGGVFTSSHNDRVVLGLIGKGLVKAALKRPNLKKSIAGVKLGPCQ